MPADGRGLPEDCPAPPGADRTCPGSEALLAFSQGKLADGTVTLIGSHVDACPHCESLLGALSDGDDTLAENVRRIARQGAAPTEPAVLRIEARAQAISLVRAGDVAPTLSDHVPQDCGQGLPLLGPYRLVRELGHGGMGAVYEAVHTRLNKVVAVKLLPAARASDPAAVARFAREMAALGELAHPHVVGATDAGEANGHPYLVMEYVEGLDLSALLRAAGPLSLSDAAEAIRQAALGLQYAFEHGRVHRDVKPSNLMLASSGTVKVLDLGLALLCAGPPPGDELTTGGQAMGTADYMAPEQWQDSHTVDIRADVYSLGCTLYKLLAGRAPFGGPGYDTARQKREAHLGAAVPAITERRDLPPEFLAVLGRMLAKDPGARFATPGAVAEALRPFTAGADLSRLVAAARAGASAAAPAVGPPAPAPAEFLRTPRESGGGGAPRRGWRPLRWWYAAAAAGIVGAAALLLSLGPWRAPRAPTQPQAPRAGEWLPLASGAPVALLWPDSPNSHWDWDAPRAELRLITDGDALIRLGESNGDFDFEVTLYQAKWGDAGIFLGWQPGTDGDKPCNRFQLIQLIAPPLDRRPPEFKLAWKAVRLFPDGSEINGDRAYAALHDLGDGDQRLSVANERGVLRGVRWNDFPLMARFLETPGAAGPRGPVGVDARGAFGVYSGRDSVYFRNARVRYKGGS